MKKYILLVVCLLILVGCGTKDKTEDKKVEEDNENIVDDEKNIDEIINKQLESMTLEEKIGQMIIISYSSSTVDNNLKELLNDVKPGGFILFKDNITTYNKTLKFIKDIKATSDIPMFIAIDQEGGSVQRLLALQDLDVSDIPYMNDVGKTKDVDLSYSIGKVIAEELRVFGINMDFAPVLDVYSNPNNKVIGKRSFGSTSDLVSSMGLSLGAGLSDNGIIPVYKHFPGHGNTSTDSHVSLPVVDKSKEELLNLDLIPFIDAINNNAEMIMIGHLAVPALTGDSTPASLSKTLVTDFLKVELGFDGLVITDALNMGALTNYYSQDEIYVQTVLSGVDLLLMPTDPKSAIKAIVGAVQNGTISEERIDESVRKILKLKYEKIYTDYNTYLSKEYLNSAEHQVILSKV